MLVATVILKVSLGGCRIDLIKVSLSGEFHSVVSKVTMSYEMK